MQIPLRMLLLECRELVLGRNADLRVLNIEAAKTSELRKRRHAAAHLGVVEEELLKLSEVLKEGQAAAHLGVVETELLEPCEVLKSNSASRDMTAEPQN